MIVYELYPHSTFSMMLTVGVTVRFIPDLVSVSKKKLSFLYRLFLLYSFFSNGFFLRLKKKKSPHQQYPAPSSSPSTTDSPYSPSKRRKQKKGAKVTLLPLHHHRLQSRMQRRRRPIHKPLNLNIRIRLFQIPPIRGPLHNPPHIPQQILITTQINRHKFSKRRQRKNHHNIRHRKFFARQPRFFRDAAVEDVEDLMHFFEIAD